MILSKEKITLRLSIAPVLSVNFVGSLFTTKITAGMTVVNLDIYFLSIRTSSPPVTRFNPEPFPPYACCSEQINSSLSSNPSISLGSSKSSKDAALIFCSPTNILANLAKTDFPLPPCPVTSRYICQL